MTLEVLLSALCWDSTLHELGKSSLTYKEERDRRRLCFHILFKCIPPVSFLSLRPYLWKVPPSHNHANWGLGLLHVSLWRHNSRNKFQVMIHPLLPQWQLWLLARFFRCLSLELGESHVNYCTWATMRQWPECWRNWSLSLLPRSPPEFHTEMLETWSWNQRIEFHWGRG